VKGACSSEDPTIGPAKANIASVFCIHRASANLARKGPRQEAGIEVKCQQVPASMPGGTGKTTWLRAQLPRALWYNLLLDRELSPRSGPSP
jgi:hypothetical protein